MLGKTTKWVGVLSLAAVLLTACTSNGATAGTKASSGASSDQSGAAASGGASASKDSSSKAGGKPVDLSIFYFDAQANDFSRDLPVIKKSEDLTNVNIKNVAPVGGDAEQAFNLMLASGEIPDIISSSLGNLNSIAVQGALQPLNKLIDKDAPNFKNFLASRPDIKKAITSSDGKIYTIPFVADGTAELGWYIRKDWLDKLHLSVPKTVNDYYKVLTAFKNDDPNGNNKKDEVPYFNRRKDNGAEQLFPLFDAYSSFYLKNGKVAYGPYEQQYKIAVANIAKWYKEGLIDKEIFTRGPKARDVLLANNTGGSTHDWFASTANYNDSLKQTVPGIDLEPMAPPASISGKVYETTTRATMNGDGWAMSAKSKNPDAVMKYFDFWWSKEGRRMFNFGIEGDTYTMVNGKPQFTAKVLSQPSVVDYLIKKEGAQLPYMGAWQDFNYEKQWTNKIALAGEEMYQNNHYIDPNYSLPALSFTQDEQNQLNQLQTNINTYVNETTQKWIMGGADVKTGFDTYINQLKKLNIDQLIKIYQDAYDRYNNG